LQTEIISKLAAVSHPLRFSELKEDGIENSLFMYHANKLIGRDLIKKDGAGFSLTLKGARWANYVDIFHNFTPITPRPLVQFIVQGLGDRVLMAARKGSLRKLLNDYLLPGDVYRHGVTLEHNVACILKDLFGEDCTLTATPLTIADIIHTADDGFVSHVISYIFRVISDTGMPEPLDHPLFTTKWVQADTITLDNPEYGKSAFLPLLFDRLPSLSAHESFLIKI
jgi:hypothetical protein